MVRGPAALLATAAAWGAGGAAGVVLLAGAVAILADTVLTGVVALLGAGLLVAALAAADAGAWATPLEAVAYGAAGALFAATLASPALAVALPVFVALVDLGGALTGDPEGIVRTADLGDPLTLELFGDGGVLSVTEPVFVGAYVALARRFDLRPVATTLLSAAALAGVVLAEVEGGVILPPLAILGAAWLLANGDRLPALLRA